MIRLGIGPAIVVAVIALAVLALVVVIWSDRNKENDRDE